MVFILGAYILGTKSGLYDATALIKESGGNIIYVSGNYRVSVTVILCLPQTNTVQLGAFGFLSGTTAEKAGITNVGLHDQRAVFRWIQDHIHLVGGDPSNVTIMGESAGGGSVLHQLIAFGGKGPALFKRAIVLSPAIAPAFDRRGVLEDQFQEFAKIAGCTGKGIPCLRNMKADALKSAQDNYIKQSSPGGWGFGFVEIHRFVRQLLTL
jgi:carboxylesterase type B